MGTLIRSTNSGYIIKELPAYWALFTIGEKALFFGANLTLQQRVFGLRDILAALDGSFWQVPGVVNGAITKYGSIYEIVTGPERLHLEPTEDDIYLVNAIDYTADESYEAIAHTGGIPV
jgi:hypothetical protein